MNPPGDDYKVEDLDPALIDRFDVYEEVSPAPNVSYMTDVAGLPKPISQALFTWWRDQNSARRGIENYISPRRLVKIGLVFMATGDAEKAIPRWVNVDLGKLKVLLNRAQQDMNAAKKAPAQPSGQKGSAQNGANPAFTYEDGWLKSHDMTVAKYLRDNQGDLDTHRAVLGVLEHRHAPRLANDYAEVMDALKPSLLEGFVADLNASRMDLLKKKIEELGDARLAQLPNLKAALGM
jgi:hypothetical protein